MEFSSDFLRTFLEVHKRRSFTLAANFLGKSQAAVSTQIRLLEQAAGLRLIDRSERPLQLTEAGRIFLEFAQETIAKAENVSGFFRELADGSKGEVVIGATTSIGAYLLPPILGRILKQRPNLKINLFTQDRKSLCDAIRQSQIDFGIILADEAPHGLNAVRLRAEPLCLVVAPSHPLAHKRVITIKNLQLTPFAIGSTSYDYTEMVDQMLRQNGLSSYPIGFRISNFEGRKECIRAGVGLTILPQYTVLEEIKKHRLTRIKVKGLDISANIILVENSRRLVSPTARQVKEIIQQAIRSR